jgi:sugar O-acyltransferase (sialic acid O-acetyltransferase NeuD family)
MSDEALQRKPIAIFGAGGHGLLIGAVLTACQDKVVFLDDRMDALLAVESMGALLVGGSEKLEDPRFLRRHDLFIGIGDNQKRRFFTELAAKHGAELAVLIDPDATVMNGSKLDTGVVVMAQAVVSYSARIGKGAIINTGAIVEHDCVVGDYANLSVGVKLMGGVRIGEMAFLGGGAIVLPKIKIGDRAIVGAGAVVTKDVPDGVTVVGNPARAVNHPDSEAILPGAGDNIVPIEPRAR